MKCWLEAERDTKAQNEQIMLPDFIKINVLIIALCIIFISLLQQMTSCTYFSVISVFVCAYKYVCMYLCLCVSLCVCVCSCVSVCVFIYVQISVSLCVSEDNVGYLPSPSTLRPVFVAYMPDLPVNFWGTLSLPPILLYQHWG